MSSISYRTALNNYLQANFRQQNNLTWEYKTDESGWEVVALGISLLLPFILEGLSPNATVHGVPRVRAHAPRKRDAQELAARYALESLQSGYGGITADVVPSLAHENQPSVSQTAQVCAWHER